MTALTSIFGNEIKVAAQPRQADRQYVGLPGVAGVMSMMLGTRGRQIIVTGRLAATGINYDAARVACQALIDAIEAYQWADAAEYSHAGTTYNYVIFDAFRLIADSEGKIFHYTKDYYVTCDFVCFLRDLI